MITPALPLLGRKALVTGSSRGIGRAIALEFARRGADVAVHFGGSRAEAEAVAAEISAGGRRAPLLQADLADASAAASLFQRARDGLGGLDVLVNNAGVIVTRPIGEISDADFDRVFAVNARAVFQLCREAMRGISPGGRVINLSTSVTGLMFPGYSVYAASKGAVEQLTRQLAPEFGARGITVNAIAPGPTETELFTEGKSAAQIERLSQMAALKRLGSTGDIAAVAAFLASEDAGWITGQVLRANGGFV